MLDIPTPPQPQVSAAITLVAAGGLIVAGAALLVWGRLLSRPFLALSGTLAGAMLAESLGRQFGLRPAAAGVLAIVGFAVIGALAARLVWAIAGGAIVAAIAMAVLLSHSLQVLPSASQPAFGSADTLTHWTEACWRYAQEGLTGVWADRSVLILWTSCLAGGVPMVALLLLPRLARIIMTALTGAVAVVAGMLLAVGRLSASVWPSTWGGYTTYGVIALVLLACSAVFQYHSDLTAKRAEMEARKKKAQAAKAADKNGHGQKFTSNSTRKG